MRDSETAKSANNVQAIGARFSVDNIQIKDIIEIIDVKF